MTRFLLPLFFVTLPFLAHCKDDVAAGPVAAAPEPIIFGVCLDKNGRKGTTGPSALPAIRSLATQVNARGGIEGRPIQFVEVDDGGESSGAVTAMQQLAQMGAVGVVGPVNSSQLVAARDDIVGHLPVISPSATASTLSGLNPAGETWIFRTAPSDTLQAKAMAKFASARAAGACTKMAIAYLDDDTYGPGFESDLKSALPSGMYAGSVKLPEDAKSDYTDEVRSVAALHPDCMALIAYDDTGGHFATSLKSVRASTPSAFPESFFVIGSDGLRTTGLITNSDPTGSGTSDADGVFYGTAPDPNPVRSQLSEFRQLLSQLIVPPEKLDTFTASAYDAAALLVLARVAAHSDDPAMVRAQLDDVSAGGQALGPSQLGEYLADPTSYSDVNYNGASGDVDFLPGGDVLSGYEVWRVSGNTFAVETQYRAEDIQ